MCHVGEPHPSGGHAHRLVARMQTCVARAPLPSRKTAREIVYDQEDGLKRGTRTSTAAAHSGAAPLAMTTENTYMRHVVKSAFFNVFWNSYLLIELNKLTKKRGRTLNVSLMLGSYILLVPDKLTEWHFF